MRKWHFVKLFYLLIFFSCSSPPPAHYVIGVDPTWFPLEAPGKESAILGFSYELLQDVAASGKLKLETVQKNWDNILLGLQNRECDAVLSSLSPHSFYEQQYTFSSPYILTGPVLVMARPMGLLHQDSLAGKEIAVPADLSYAALLEGYAKVIVRSYDMVAQVLQDVASGKVDGALIPVLIAEGYCLDLYKDKLFIVTPPLNQEGLRLVTLKGHADVLRTAFDEELKTMHKKGAYDALLRKWSLLSLSLF